MPDKGKSCHLLSEILADEVAEFHKQRVDLTADFSSNLDIISRVKISGKGYMYKK